MITILLMLLVSFNSYLISDSELDRFIPGEIKNDSFYEAIYRLAKSPEIKTMLEIGSSSGDGSTEAFVKGMAENPACPTLFCMEISKPRFAQLKTRYAHHTNIKCYNVSSIALEDFPAETEIRNFFNTVNSNLRMYGCERVLGWLRQDIEYVKDSQVPQDGIELIKQENNIQSFDMVLIDGSEFTGKAEFKHVYGAKYILLDDINAFKNYQNYQTLRNDSTYELVEENHLLRNGYAIFKRK